MTIFMETTRINPERTVGEIQDILRDHGANAILLEYEGKQISAVLFKVDVEGHEMRFRLPCRWREMESCIKASGKNPRHDDTFETWARRVAWRQILRWVEAQFALIETNMVKLQEVFLPYAQTESGQTIYEYVESRNFKMIGHTGAKP